MHTSTARPLPRPRLFLLLTAALAAAACQQAASSPDIQIADAGKAITVAGLSARDLAALKARERSSEEWQAVLRVAVARDGDGAATNADLPPVAGSYRLSDTGLVFTPAFGLDPGRRYAVTYVGPTGDRVSNVVGLPAVRLESSTAVVRMYPTTDEVPENLLRLYVHFSAPMGTKGGLAYMRLLDADGREVKDPFLPVDAEFWNGDRTRFTMFFDPGRVKRGILPNEQMGRPMRAGRSYTLVVAREWLDGRGMPLKEEFRRAFRVGAADMKPLDPKTWRVQPPPAGGREAVSVAFSEPLDHGLLMRALGVATADGTQVPGEAAIGADETSWSFTPRDAWRAGDYHLVVLTILEDLAGNRIGRAFEVDEFERVDSGQQERVTLPFTIP